jgi:hypothetical protein
MRALAQANRVRLARAELKRQVAEGEATVADVVINRPWEAESMTIGDLLMSQHRWGRTRCRRFLASIPMVETKTIGSMTERQRNELARRLNGDHAGPCYSLTLPEPIDYVGQARQRAAAASGDKVTTPDLQDVMARSRAAVKDANVQMANPPSAAGETPVDATVGGSSSAPSYGGPGPGDNVTIPAGVMRREEDANGGLPVVNVSCIPPNRGRRLATLVA